LRRFRAAPARPEGIQRAVGGDPVKPGAHRRASFELLKPTPRGKQSLLEQVLGVLYRADDPIDVKLQLTPIRVSQLAERVSVAATRAGEGLLGHARILALAVPFIRVMSNDVGAARKFGDVVSEIAKLKQDKDGDIVVPGSFQLLHTLIEHDLVDELRLKIFPVVLGAGERLFGETNDKKPMRLVETQALDDGIAYLTYERLQDA
jgi:hypothetical protein